METENLTQYTRPQLAFLNRLRTVKVRCALLKSNLRPSPYAIFPISIHVFRLKVYHCTDSYYKSIPELLGTIRMNHIF